MALMLLLKPQLYIANRGPIITAVRLLYMLSAIMRGLQHCSTVTKWVDGIEIDSALSAFLWHTGIIAMLWHGSVFRLPFWQAFYLQSTAAMAYALFLAADVCETLDNIQHGARTVAAAQQTLQAGRAVWELATFVVTGSEALVYDLPSTNGLGLGHHNTSLSVDKTPLGAHPLGAHVSFDSSNSSGSDSSLALLQQQACVHTVRCWQILLGHVLLSAILYCLEKRDRRRWLHSTYGHLLTRNAAQQQQQEQQQQEQWQEQWQEQRQHTQRVRQR